MLPEWERDRDVCYEEAAEIVGNCLGMSSFYCASLYCCSLLNCLSSSGINIATYSCRDEVTLKSIKVGKNTRGLAACADC